MSSETPPVSAAAQVGVLRRAWLDGAATAAPQLPGLPSLLDARLTDLEDAGALAESSLLAVVEEASQYALEQGAGEVARALSKRLRRAIYEFLLALDAVNPAEMANAPVLTPPPAVAPAEPRTPVAFTPADVPGADEPVALTPPPAPVPLWEAVAPPPVVREVYHVPGRDVVPVADPEPVADAPVETVDEMGAEPEAAFAEFAEAEEGADFAEAQGDEAEAHAAEVVDDVAAVEQADAAWAEAQDFAAEVAGQNGHSAEAGAEAHAVAEWTAEPSADGEALQPAAEAFSEAAGEAATPAEADGFFPEPVAQLGTEPDEDAAEAFTLQPTAETWPAAPDAAEAFVSEHADEAVAAEPFDANANGASGHFAGFAPEAAGEAFAPEAVAEDAFDAAGDVAPEAAADAVAPQVVAEDAFDATADRAPEAAAGFAPEPIADAADHAAEALLDLAPEGAPEPFTPAAAAAEDTTAAHVAPETSEVVPTDPAAEAFTSVGEAATSDPSALAAVEPEPTEAYASLPPAADTTPESAPHDAPAEPWSAPIVELPVPPSAADAPQLHVVPPANGAKPPRDLLRVPRQFRRLTPLHANGSTEQAPVETPAAALPPAAPHLEHDDDAFGVPSVPWMLAQPQAPEPPAAEAEPDPPAPEEEDEGVPFNPFAAAADDDADLPRPPALAEEPLHPLPAAQPPDQLFIQPLPGNDAPQLWTPGPVPTPDYALPKPPAAADPFPIAPLEGFHLTDPGALDLASAANPFLAQPEAEVPAAVPPAPPAPEPPLAAPQHADEAHDDDGVWRIRQSPRAQLLAERMAQKRREEASRAAFEAASFHDDDHGHGRGRRRGKQDEALPDMSTARRQLDEHLRKKRGAEAGSLLQRLAQEMGGRDIADLALDAGDRCRALGQSRSATNCYLAAWRADPLYETPLWRLSDVCLNDQEIDLAVGYLERIAELMRSRGDDEGAIGVYRKIAMIAPERQDVRDVIRLAKTTGRLDG